MTDIYGNYSPQGQSGFTVPPPKAGKGSMIMAVIGGIMAMIGPFMLYLVMFSWDGNTETEWLSITDLESDDFYMWFSVLGGLLAMLMAPLAYGGRSQGFAKAAGLCGLMAMAMPVLFILFNFILEDGGDLLDGIFYFDEYVSYIFVGGIMTFFGGASVAMGGFGLASKIKRAADTQNDGWLRPQPTPRQEPSSSFNDPWTAPPPRGPNVEQGREPPRNPNTEQSQGPPRVQPRPGPGAAVTCTNCGCRIESGWKACVSCGAKVSPVCASCGSPMKPGWKMCPECGKPV